MSHHRIRAAVITSLIAATLAAGPAVAHAKTLPTQSQGVAWGANASGQLGDGSPYSNSGDLDRGRRILRARP